MWFIVGGLEETQKLNQEKFQLDKRYNFFHPWQTTKQWTVCLYRLYARAVRACVTRPNLMGDPTLRKSLNERPPEVPSTLNYPVVQWKTNFFYLSIKILCDMTQSWLSRMTVLFTQTEFWKPGMKFCTQLALLAGSKTHGVVSQHSSCAHWIQCDCAEWQNSIILAEVGHGQSWGGRLHSVFLPTM